MLQINNFFLDYLQKEYTFASEKKWRKGTVSPFFVTNNF